MDTSRHPCTGPAVAMPPSRGIARAIAASLAAAALVAGSGIAGARAQEQRAKTVQSGELVRLEIVPNIARRSCQPISRGEVRIDTLVKPRNGVVYPRIGRLLTPATYRCPNQNVAVMAAFYRSNPSFVGREHVVLKVTVQGEAVVERIDIDVQGH